MSLKSFRGKSNSLEDTGPVEKAKKPLLSEGVRKAGSVAALLFGLLLLLLSIFVAAGAFPSVRGALSPVVSSIAPGLSPTGITEGAAVVILAVAVALMFLGSVDGAGLLIQGLFRLLPSFEGSVNRSALVVSLGAGVSETMIRAGVTGRPLAYVRKYATYAVATAMITVPASIALTFIFTDPLFLLINFAPLLVLLYPRFATTSKVGDTVRGVEEELPYFAIVAAILQSAGLTLYDALTKAAGSKIFKWMEYEGMLVARESMFFGKTQVGAIQERGTQHASERFRSYLQGYTSVLASGGDATNYLEEKAKDLVYWTEFRWRAFASAASDLGEAIIAIFFTLPLIVIAGAFVSPGDTIALIVGTIVVGVPILAVLEYSAIIRIQPKSYDVISGWTLPGVTVAFALFAIAYFFHQPVWMSAAIGIVGFSAIYGWSTFWQLREIRKVEDALPQFMRDITEYKKIGYDITKAVRRLASERKYNGYFDGVLKDIATQIQLGSTLKESIVKSRSWLAKMMFYLLGEVVETGGGSPALLETVTGFTQRIVGVRRETRASMRVYSMLAYATPVGLAIVIITMYYMLQQFGGILGQGQSFGILSAAITLPPGFLDLAKVLVIEAAAVVGFLAGRTIDFTGKNTLRIATAVGFSIVAILVIQFLVPALGVLTV